MITLIITGISTIILLGLSLYMLIKGYKYEAKFLVKVATGSTLMILGMIMIIAWAGV